MPADARDYLPMTCQVDRAIRLLGQGCAGLSLRGVVLAAIATFPVVWFGTSPTLAIAVGAAAGMTAQTRLLLTSILSAALLVGTKGRDAVLAAAAAWPAVTALDRPTSTSTP
jgi:hypothetical protein